MSVTCWAFNSLISVFYKKEYKKFLKISDSQKVQETILFDTLKKNRNTLYGEKFNFKNIESIKKFQENVPLSEYEDYIPYIELIKNGNQKVITAEEVKLFELTSGSTASSKFIPYTSGLKKQFLAGIKPWIYDIYKNYPKVKNGKSYWSITPVIGEKTFTKGGIPIGFEDDSEYLGDIEKYFFNKIFAVPKEISHCADMDQFYRETAVKLLLCKNLSLVSIWNPTFFILIIDYIKKRFDEISKYLPEKRRSKIRNYLESDQIDKIWPKLEIISCWADGCAENHRYSLAKIFPNVTFQPKGIISTEGFISFPMVGSKGSIISINSHFFEFMDIEDNNIYLLWNIKIGKRYEIVITTAGGFYRYKTGDIAVVIGKKNKIPVIKFLGRRNNVCDLFGEKLNEEFLKNIMDKLSINIEFYMFAPQNNRYTLYIKTQDEIPDIDQKLRSNFHYDYCRKLGQLKKLKVFKLNGNAIQEYAEFCVKNGQKLGNIKPPILSKLDVWDKIFNGEYL